jgi:hypothetical protein
MASGVAAPDYQKDILTPANSSESVRLDEMRLAQFPIGYRHLAYVQELAGYMLKPDMPCCKVQIPKHSMLIAAPGLRAAGSLETVANSQGQHEAQVVWSLLQAGCIRKLEYMEIW